MMFPGSFGPGGMQQGMIMPGGFAPGGMQQGMMMPQMQQGMMMPGEPASTPREPGDRSRTRGRTPKRGAAASGRRLGRNASAGSAASGGNGRARSRSPRGLPRFKDDHHGVSSSFKSLGLEHINGKKRVMPKSFRASMIAACDPVLFPMYRLAALSSQDTDFLNYLVTGCSPATRPVDFQVSCKRDLRMAARDAYELKQSTQPGRLRALGEEWDNIASLAMRLGYHPEWLETHTYRQWAAHQQQAQRSSFASGSHQTPEQFAASMNAEPPPQRRAQPALADGAAAVDGFGSQTAMQPPRPRQPVPQQSRQVPAQGLVNRRPLERHRPPPQPEQHVKAPPALVDAESPRGTPPRHAARERGPTPPRQTRGSQTPPRHAPAREPLPSVPAQAPPLPNAPVSWSLPQMRLPGPSPRANARRAAADQDLSGSVLEQSYMQRMRAMRRSVPIQDAMPEESQASSLGTNPFDTGSQAINDREPEEVQVEQLEPLEESHFDDMFGESEMVGDDGREDGGDDPNCTPGREEGDDEEQVEEQGEIL